MNLLLTHLRWWSEGRERQGDLRLRRGKIVESGRNLPERRSERVVDAAGWVAYPGLINAHDHLDLNLFPFLGNPPYGNFYECVDDVYRPDRSPVREILRVGLRDRLWWGAYRNLISGVTTVIHHDPYYWWVFGRQLFGRRLFRRRLFGRPFPVRVLKRYGWCHSLGGAESGYGQDPVRAHRRSSGRPFILHAAEGTDRRAQREIDEIDQLGLLGPSTVLVHAIAVSERQRARVAETGSSIVWCPATNLKLYEGLPPIRELLGSVRVALGTDSTLTGSPTLLGELKVAEKTGLAEPAELLDMVTSTPAQIFGLRDGRGRIRPGAPADLVLVKDRGGRPPEVLLGSELSDLDLVLVGGAPRAASPDLARELGLGAPNARVEGKLRWLSGDLAALCERIVERAGEVVWQNPVWRILAV